MNGAFAGIAVTVLIFAGLVLLIRWLSNQSSRWRRMIGALIAGALTIYCLIVVVAVVSESWRAATPSVAGLAVIVVFAVTAVSAVYAAFKGFHPRRPSPSPPSP
jgi:uncharacterized BrkB/YihY/UPF0761 family membrane protein